MTRMLFVNQGQGLSTTAMGLLPVHDILQRHMPSSVDGTYRMLGPVGYLAQRTVIRPVPALPGGGWADLRWFYLRSRSARQIIRQELSGPKPPQVVHLTSNDLALGTRRLQKQVPCVATFDVTLADWLRLLHRVPEEQPLPAPLQAVSDAESEALSHAPLAVGWTEHVSRRIRMLSPKTRVETLHPGLDLKLFQPRTGRRRPGPMRVLFVGGRFTAKGGPQLVTAVEQMGGLAELHAVTTESVPPHPLVTVHSARPGTQELAERFRDADLLALPTKVDAAPWVVLEAMATGLPVVSTPVGSIPEMIGPDAGAIVAPDDIDALTDGLRRVLDDPASVKQRGAAARARVEEHYNASTNAPLLAEFLSQVATG